MLNPVKERKFPIATALRKVTSTIIYSLKELSSNQYEDENISLIEQVEDIKKQENSKTIHELEEMVQETENNKKKTCKKYNVENKKRKNNTIQIEKNSMKNIDSQER